MIKEACAKSWLKKKIIFRRSVEWERLMLIAGRFQRQSNKIDKGHFVWIEEIQG